MKKRLVLITAVLALEIFLFITLTTGASILQEVEGSDGESQLLEPEETVGIRISGGNAQSKDRIRIFSPDKKIPLKSSTDFEENEAMPNYYTSQCSIQQLEEGASTYTHVCGCTLVSEDTCLTSAHCMENSLQGKYTRIICGVHNLTNTEEAGLQVRDVHNWIFQPDYDYYEMWDDICLVKANSSFDTTGKYVKTAKICSSGQGSEDNIFVVGWSESNPDILHEIKANTSSFDECAHTYIETAAIIESQSCFETQDKSCFVDSGGIIFKEEEADEKCVLALASFGALPCGQRDWPSVYTNVLVYRGWIEETLEIMTPASSSFRDSEF